MSDAPKILSMIVGLALSQSSIAAQLPGTGIGFEPAITVAVQQDDNVYYREENLISDSSVIINPRLSITSDLGIRGDSIALRMDYRQETYATESNLDNDEYRIDFTGVKTISRQQYLELTAESEKTVLSTRGADSFGRVPDTLEQREVALAYRYERGSVPLSLSVGSVSWRYAELGMAAAEDGDARDRDETAAQIAIGYAPSRDRGLYLTLRRGELIGKSSRSDADARDGSTMEWRLGFRFKTPDLIDLRADLGLYSLVFDDAGFNDVSEVVHELRAAFSLTPLTTLRFDSSNNFEITRLAGSPGYKSLNNRLTLTHDFASRIQLGVYLSRGADTFLDSDVEDKTSEQGLSLRYRPGRHLSVFATAAQETRKRNRVSAESFEEASIERAVFSAGIGYEM